tara:strand:- start:4 stop:165 length:162 start_codon:yes stop_codon:yes gene_type:complete
MQNIKNQQEEKLIEKLIKILKQNLKIVTQVGIEEITFEFFNPGSNDKARVFFR